MVLSGHFHPHRLLLHRAPSSWWGLFGIDINTSILVTALLGGLLARGRDGIGPVPSSWARPVSSVSGGPDRRLGLDAAVEPVKLTVLRIRLSLPWYAAFLGYPIDGLWYWCADQTIVQRVLGAKDERNARLGPLFAGFIKILPVFLFVLPGPRIAYGLVRQGALPAPGRARPTSIRFSLDLPRG